MIVQDAGKELKEELEQQYNSQIELLLGNAKAQAQKKIAIALENAKQKVNVLLSDTTKRVQTQEHEKLQAAQMQANAIVNDAKNELLANVQKSIKRQISELGQEKREAIVVRLLNIAKAKAKEQGILEQSTIKVYKGVKITGTASELDDLRVEIENATQVISLGVDDVLKDLKDRIVRSSLDEIEKRCNV